MSLNRVFVWLNAHSDGEYWYVEGCDNGITESGGIYCASWSLSLPHVIHGPAARPEAADGGEVPLT